MMTRVRQLETHPVCKPAKTIEELRWQVNFLLDDFERELLKQQMESMNALAPTQPPLS